MVEVGSGRPGGAFQAESAACGKPSGRKNARKFQILRGGPYDLSRESTKGD